MRTRRQSDISTHQKNHMAHMHIKNGREYACANAAKGRANSCKPGKPTAFASAKLSAFPTKDEYLISSSPLVQMPAPRLSSREGIPRGERVLALGLTDNIGRVSGYGYMYMRVYIRVCMCARVR